MSQAREQNVKQCCAAFYGSDIAHLLLGDSFHPGVAAGRGTSAFHLAQCFGCEVVGIDLSEENVKLAREEAITRGVADRVSFQLADAETLPFEADTFDAILCECAFCTFPNKQTAVGEFSRVLKPGGRLGLSDLTKTVGPIPELDGLFSWIACMGDAQPVESYSESLKLAGLTIEEIEDHSYALTELVRQIQGKLLGAEIAAGLKKLAFPNVSFSDAKRFAQAALGAVRNGELGYVVISAVMPR